MRVNPISCTPIHVVRNSVQNKVNEKSYQISKNNSSAVSFNGIRWGGAIGGIVGTCAGIGIGAIATIASGGLLAPVLIGTIGGTAGAIGGDMIDAKINKDYPKDDDKNSDSFDDFSRNFPY